jgi:hypothetical protein
MLMAMRPNSLIPEFLNSWILEFLAWLLFLFEPHAVLYLKNPGND